MVRLTHQPSVISNQPLRASDTFRRYGPMDKHEVRKQEVVGNRQEAVRRTREMLRSMTPEQVKQVIEFHRDLTVFEALALAKREGKIIVPNDIHDRVLTETRDKKYLEQNYPVWTGTLVIYEKPDKKFGKGVTFSWKHDEVKYSVSFTVPKQFQGKRSCALVIEHPDFDLVDLGNNRYEIKLVDESNIHLIESFPNKGGWYMPHAETGILQGEPVKESNKAIYLWRIFDSYIGLLLRDVVDGGGWQDVVVNGRLSDVVGVHLVPLAAAEK